MIEQNKTTVTLWIVIWSVIDSYFTVQLMGKYDMLGEVNIFYNFTPMSLGQAMVFTTFLGVTLGFLLYERNRLLAEIIVLAVTLFGIVNMVSYYFVPIEYKSYVHTVQFLILLSYIPISFLKRDKENGEIRPLFLS